MTILQAGTDDLQEILALQYLAYQSEAKLNNDPNIPPLRQTLGELRREFDRGVFLKGVEADGAIIGSVRAYSEGCTLYIGKLIVRPDWQGQGIGTKLLAAIESTAPGSRYELFTSSRSIRNIRLYERLGYRTFTEKPPRAGLTMVYMEKRGDAGTAPNRSAYR